MPLVQTELTLIEYHKIDTLFERDGKTFVVDPSKLRKPVFGTITEWDVTEKIDGTNIRIGFTSDGNVHIGGRTNKAQLPADFLQAISRHFTTDLLREVFWIDGKPTAAILFGEGYGAGFQKGGCYRPDKAFILFDVLVDGKWWLDWAAVCDVAKRLSVDTVPLLGRWTLSEIVRQVQAGIPSRAGQCQAEGIVARPIETLFDKRGERVIIKLKTKDFVPGKR